eukprot:Gregarina_sp_Poly_1__9788@NODE_624_length_7087_cov_45_976353_g478_i0_p3_GENE_NODE_624_length_7087_cov_45_976353_g478_i0NODE_624_length_7087_cov_45_976353_g478_i0_p3_ORF_typecomplete_len322_score43_41_NODE_624_length_7087_cov_45_976353_g478_i01741139
MKLSARLTEEGAMTLLDQLRVLKGRLGTLHIKCWSKGMLYSYTENGASRALGFFETNQIFAKTPEITTRRGDGIAWQMEWQDFVDLLEPCTHSKTIDFCLKPRTTEGEQSPEIPSQQTRSRRQGWLQVSSLHRDRTDTFRNEEDQLGQIVKTRAIRLLTTEETRSLTDPSTPKDAIHFSLPDQFWGRIRKSILRAKGGGGTTAPETFELRASLVNPPNDKKEFITRESMPENLALEIQFESKSADFNHVQTYDNLSLKPECKAEDDYFNRHLAPDSESYERPELLLLRFPAEDLCRQLSQVPCRSTIEYDMCEFCFVWHWP